jgi:hypothetical protein
MLCVNNINFGKVLLLNIYKGELLIIVVRFGKVLFSIFEKYLLLYSSNCAKLLFWLLIPVKLVFVNNARGVVTLLTKLKYVRDDKLAEFIQ